jgi:hypothetical protein
LVEVCNFSLGVGEPSGEGEGGSNFLLLEVGKVDFQLSFKIKEEVVDLFGVGVTAEVLVVLLGSKLGELLDGISLEEVAVHGESISNVGADLGEWAGLVGEVSTKVLLKEGHDFEGILMVLDGLNEESVGVTSLVWKFLRSAGDFTKSVVGPINPVQRVSQLAFQILSVVFSVLPVLLVDVSNVSEITNDSGTNVFVSSVLLVSSDLHLDVFSLEVSEHVVHW